MPSAAAIARSSGVVMNPRTSSALAPTYAVVTVTDAISLRGYCRTFRVLMACNPAIRITRLTTRASTGRRIKRSVMFFTAKRSTVGRLGRELGLRRELVIDHDVHSIAQLEDAGAHHLFSCL